MTSNVADLLSATAVRAPARTALVDAAGERRVTWAELDDCVSRVAAGLAEQGLVAGNRVVIATANRLEFAVVYLAVLRARLVAVPVNPRSATGELLRMVTDCRARLVVADSSTVTDVRAVVAGMQEALAGADESLRSRSVVPRVVALDCPGGPGELDYGALLACDPSAARPAGLSAGDPESLAALLYTSGTSSRPRAAMLSHRALLANIEQAAAVRPPMVGPDDVVLGVLPLHHVYGLNAVLGQVVGQGATLVVVDGFDPVETLALVGHHGVTVLPVAPAVLAHWRDAEDLRDRLAPVRTVMSGSAPLSVDVADDFERRSGLVVHQGYGLTEAAPVVTSTRCSAVVKPGSVGSALPGVALRLLDERGRRPSDDDPGQILVAGDNLFSGYWPDGDGAPVEGWLATGDIGFLDPDGDLFLVDRLKELVIVSGFNVYPSEIEEVLDELDGVLDSAVIGVPDPATGEAVVAYLTTGLSDPEDVADLVDRAHGECRRRLARFKQPSTIEVVEALPRTVTGKVAKGRLRAGRRSPGLLE